MTDTYPDVAGNLKIGGYVVLKDHPCKVIQYSVSKTKLNLYIKLIYKFLLMYLLLYYE